MDETYVIHGSTLTEIADAIRLKKNITTRIPVLSMAREIAGINGVADSQFEINYFQDSFNGSYYDGTVVTLPSQAFKGIQTIQDVRFLKCTSIDLSAFMLCTGLINASFPVCRTIYTDAFRNCYSLTTISFPICTSVGSSAFMSCRSLIRADFPKCTRIDASAFRSCSGLTEINLPVCQSIYNNAFHGCSNLRSIDLPSCKFISEYTFAHCVNLSTINLYNCSIISRSAFYDCSNLTTIILNYSKVAALYDTSVFAITPMSNSRYTGSYGSIYVPASLVSSYQKAAYWSYYSSRITAIT